MTEKIIWPLLFLLCMVASCATPRSSGGRAEISGNAQVESVDTSSTQTERGTSVQDANITGNVVTSNGDLGKGWGGMLAIGALIVLSLLIIAVAAPAPPAPWNLYLMIGGVIIFITGIGLIWSLFT